MRQIDAGRVRRTAALAAHPGGHRHGPWPLSIAAASCQSAGRRSQYRPPIASSRSWRGTATHQKQLDADEGVAEAARQILPRLRRNHGCGALGFSSQVGHPRDREVDLPREHAERPGAPRLRCSQCAGKRPRRS